MKYSSIIGDIEPQTKIYRIFSQVRFFELFEEKRNTLVQPKKWDDPFENIFLESPVMAATGEFRSFCFHDAVYGQCWTLESRSDAMWQIYSNNGDGIRVRTTVGKLLDSLRTVHGDQVEERCFVGRVKYLKVRQLLEFGKTMFVGYSPTEAIARSLLLKRIAFRHEYEVRSYTWQDDTLSLMTVSTSTISIRSK